MATASPTARTDSPAVSARILIVEDGQAERESLARVLRLENFEVLVAKDGEQALEMSAEPIDLVITDLRMGGASGLDVLRGWRRQRPETPVILLTAYGDVETAVDAMKLGAKDFLTKPVKPSDLIALVNKAVASKRAPVGHGPRARVGIESIVGRSHVMRQVCDQTKLAAHTDSIVLVLGETGTGKELIAEAIHRNSPRQDGPFVVVNMPAIPESLVESELFGHIRGSFTGAMTDRVGRFESAHGGTIFIDEIGDFPLGLQAKLLRVLENHTITPVGSNNDIAVDARVVAATSRNLAQMTAEGRFREDLYYRLNVVTVKLPPLRERREDIPLLVNHFIEEFCGAASRGPLTVEPPLMHALVHLDWPGNVRQLRNTVENMVTLSLGGALSLGDLPATASQSPHEATQSIVTMTPAPDLETMQKQAIIRALEQFHGNRTRAARYLGISVRTLQRKLKVWRLTDIGREPQSTVLMPPERGNLSSRLESPTGAPR